jgi:hypothetical protein
MPRKKFAQKVVPVTAQPKKLTRKRLHACVAGCVDTAGTKINVAEASRVISIYFRQLLAQTGGDVPKVFQILGDEVRRAQELSK